MGAPDAGAVSRKTSRTQQLELDGVAALKASAVFDLPAHGEKREVPTEFRVFPAGTFSTVKGSYTFSPRSADAVMSHYSARENPLMGDYEHQTDATRMGFPPTIAPASITEMTPEVRLNASGEPELWVTNIKWTDRAKAFLESGEYRMFSPTFMHDRETREILALLRIALTNDPAIDGLEPLVAASSGSGGGNDEDEELENVMSETCAKCASTSAHLSDLKVAHESLKAQHEGLVKQHQELLTSHDALTAKMNSFDDWAAEEKQEHEALKALTGKEKKGEILGVLTAWKGHSEELATLKTSVEKERIERLTADYKAKADEAVTTGKLPPAVRATCDAIAAKSGVAQAMEFLTAFAGEMVAPIVKTRETGAPTQEQTEQLAMLTADELAYARQRNLDVAVLAKSKAAHVARLNQ